jgi:tight adherence protein B
VNQLTVFYLFTFAAVLLAVQGIYWIFSEQKRSRQAVNRRLLLAQSNQSARETLEKLRRERGLTSLEDGRFAKLNEFLTQTGIRLDARWISVLAFVLSMLFFLAFSLAVGFGALAFIFGVICSVMMLCGWAALVRRRRIARFSEQLPDAIDIIVRGVKAGYPFTIALGLVGKEMPDPIGSEFGLTADEISFGANLGSALDNLHRRVGQSELLYLGMAIKVQTETGGNLAEVLGRLAKLMRERAMLALKIRSLTAEGRISAVVLSIFPFALFGVITLLKPDYYTSVNNSPVFMPALVLGLALLAIGNLIIYKMVNFRV